MGANFRKIIVYYLDSGHGKKSSRIPTSVLEQKARAIEGELTQELSDLLYLFLGVLSASFGLRGFLMPGGFIDGGVTGVSLMLNSLTDVSFSLFLVCINLPFLVLAYFAIGKRFAVKSVIGIVLLAVAVALIPFPMVTDDKILIAAFGGLFLGLGIGLAIRGEIGRAHV